MYIHVKREQDSKSTFEVVLFPKHVSKSYIWVVNPIFTDFGSSIKYL